ncbi:MAG: hypothetical protein E7662_03625 [Ruminococcaceae bacterium]|nr:hypothetical protein [Oscillospiraceae bacterium]
MKLNSRILSALCLVLCMSMLFGSFAAQAAEPKIFDAEYIVNGTYGSSKKSAHEFWRHSVAELTKEDGVSCLHMVAATDEKHPTQVNIYWADVGATTANGGIDLKKTPYMLMRYKTTLSGKYQIVLGPNTAYLGETGTVTSGGWKDSIVNLDTAKISKGKYLQVINELRIRFWGESASKNYVGEEFWLEYIAFFETKEAAEAFSAARTAASTTAAAVTKPAAPTTPAAPATMDFVFLPAIAASAAAAGAVAAFRKKNSKH